MVNKLTKDYLRRNTRCHIQRYKRVRLMQISSSLYYYSTVIIKTLAFYFLKNKYHSAVFPSFFAASLPSLSACFIIVATSFLLTRSIK